MIVEPVDAAVSSSRPARGPPSPTRLVRAHEIEDPLPRIRYHHLHQLRQIPPHKLLVRLSGRLLVEQRVEEVEQVDPRVEVDASALLHQAVPDVVTAFRTVFERKGGDLLNRGEGGGEAGEEGEELESDLRVVGVSRATAWYLCIVCSPRMDPSQLERSCKMEGRQARSHAVERTRFWRKLPLPSTLPTMNLAGSDDEDVSFGVNKNFAAAYETKKRTEELSKRAPSSSPPLKLDPSSFRSLSSSGQVWRQLHPFRRGIRGGGPFV